MHLSPLATEFHPHQDTVEVQGMGIYNNGEPAMVGYEDEILHGISDSALDENFPPDAQEAAELEAVEFFVDMMATLSILEDREQSARDHFTGFGKRWEARREDGLVGKPRLPKHLISAVNHNPTTQVGKPLQSSDLVPFAHSNRELATALLESRRQQRQEFKRMNNKSNQVTRAHTAPKRLLHSREAYGKQVTKV